MAASRGSSASGRLLEPVALKPHQPKPHQPSWLVGLFCACRLRVMDQSRSSTVLEQLCSHSLERFMDMFDELYLRAAQAADDALIDQVCEGLMELLPLDFN